MTNLARLRRRMHDSAGMPLLNTFLLVRYQDNGSPARLYSSNDPRTTTFLGNGECYTDGQGYVDVYVQENLAYSITAFSSERSQLAFTSDVTPNDLYDSRDLTQVGSPTTNTISGVLVTGTPAAGMVLTATAPTSANWQVPPVTTIPQASVSTQGTIRLAGDLEGSASSVTVAKIRGVAIPAVAPSAGQVLTAIDGSSAGWFNPASGAGDATAGSKGVLQLGGDLTGSGSTATAPRVSGIHGIVVSSSAPTAGQVLTASSPSTAAWSNPASGSGDATSSGKGVIQLAGDLAGSGSTAAAPRVAGLQGVSIQSSAPTAGQVLTATSGTAAAWSNPASGLGDATTSTKGAVQLSGDVGGTASSLLVTGLRGVAVSTTAPTAGQVLTASSASAASWQSFSGGSAPDATISVKGVIQLSGDLTGNANSPTVQRINGVALPSSSPAVGNVLTATGAATTAWQTPVGASLATTFNTGTITLAGDLTGVSSAPTVASIRGVVVSSTSPTAGQILQASGASSASWVTPASTTPADAAATTKGILQLAGDLSGSASLPSVVAVRGVSISASAPTTGQVLQATSASTAGWSSLAVTPEATSTVKGIVQLSGDLGGTSSSVSVLSLRGVAVSATSPTNGQVLTATSATTSSWSTPSVVSDATSTVKGLVQLANDLSGSSSSPSVVGVRGVSVSSTAPTTGQVLTALSGTSAQWSTPAAVPEATPSIKGSIQLAGDLSGTSSSPSVLGLRGVVVSATAPTSGQVLTASSSSAASWISPVVTADATSSMKGVIQLSGDIGGSSSSPSVTGLRGVTISSSSPTVGQILTATSGTAAQWSTPASGAGDATTSIKGVVQLAGDLSGSGSSATSPKVSGLQGVSIATTAPTAGQVLTATSGTAASWSTPASGAGDATGSVKGVVQLTGDLSGVGSAAASPKVSGLQGVSVSSTAPSAGQVLTATSTSASAWSSLPDSSSLVKGVVQLTNDFGGSASAPVVAALRGVTLSTTAPTAGQILTASSGTSAAWSTYTHVDASSTVKGILRIAGDISGSATSVSVVAVRGVAVSATAPTSGQVLTASSGSAAAWTTPATTSDATTSVKGVIQISGDISGTASSITVSGLRGVAVSATAPTSGQVLTASGASSASWATPAAGAGDATTSVKGVLQLGGDLSGASGTAAAPRVSGIQGVSVTSTSPTTGQVLTATSGTAAQWSTPASTGDSTTSVKGLIQLAGDLAGSGSTAAAPKVSGIQGISVSSTAPTAGQILTASSGTTASWSTFTQADSTTSSKGIVQLAGDLGGSASSPSVLSVRGVAVSATAPTANQVLTASSATAASWVTPVSVADSTSLAKGLVQLAGDLNGSGSSASAPKVSGLQGVSVSSTAPTVGQVLTASSASAASWSSLPAATDASTSVKGVVQLTGDLGGTATSPAVTKINGISLTGTPAVGWIPLATSTTSAAWSNPSALDATTSAKGLVQLTGDLAGSASAPSVVGVRGVTVSATAPSSGQALIATSSTTASWTTISTGSVENVLTSTSTTNPLSANMGKALNDRLVSLEDSTTVDISASVTINSGNRATYDNKVWKFSSGSFVVTINAGVKIDAICLTPSSGSAGIAFGAGVTGNGGTSTITRTATNGLAFSIFHTGTDAYFVTGDSGGGAADATSSATGSVQLAGDLAGSGSTAAAPKVSGIQGISVSSTAPTTGQVLTATSASAAAWSTPSGSSSDATSAAKGVVQLAGDLSGSGSSAAAPRVSGIQSVNISATAPSAGQALIATSASDAAWTTPTTATTSQFGVVKLSGDLGGTAGSPSVLKLGGGITLPVSQPTAGQILVASSGTVLGWSTVSPQIVAVGSSRNLAGSDDGRILSLTGSALTLTIPAGVALRRVEILVNGATVIAVSGGATINGGTTSITRNSSSNQAVTLYGTSVTDVYRLTGV